MKLRISDFFQNKFKLINESEFVGFKPVKLHYNYNELNEFIDAETMDIHYNKHYKGYINQLNSLLKERNFKFKNIKSLEDFIKKINSFGKKIKNQGGGAYNHELFWNFLTPDKEKRKFEGKIKELIESQFGSLDEFKKEFLKVAKTRFGSGWCWVVISNNKLKIITTPNQDNPKMNIFLNKDKNNEGTFFYKSIPGKIILGLDLWEHAYYLKYKNNKEDYVNNFWKVVNWEHVNSSLKK